MHFASLGAVLSLVCLILPAAVNAGPWPRGEGNLFVTSEAVFDRVGKRAQIAHRHYLEYGLNAQVTLGATLERQSGWVAARRLALVTGLQAAPWRGALFWRWHPGALQERTPVALELQMAPNPRNSGDRLRFAAHIGHGFELLERSAWARLSVSAGVANRDMSGQRDASVQIGIEAWTGARVWLDGTLTVENTTRIPRLGVMSAHDLSETYSMTLGYSRTFGSWREHGVRIGLWAQF
ncbi:MAG: hypothetical protein JJU09_10915 [Rhodobacteraceae bacterium]|nr:hypothetical protein [Paracoccaceae bacterium]TVR46987.1 MAG: hypothetical protein EA386_08665 [Paracoccaceae bacterium]